jgi:hypothetical protein
MGILDSTPLSGMFYNPSKDDEKAKRAMEKGIQVLQDVPDANYTPVEYKGPEYAGDVYAGTADAPTMGASAYENISLDPEMRMAQTAQISALERLRDEGGMNLTDKANLQRIQNDELNKEKSQREAILQGARARGMGGSGSELMALLGANQAGTNRQFQRDLDVAGMAQDRALQAGGQAAGLAGNVRGQDWQQESARANAADAASKFNASMISNTNQFNVGNQLRAGMSNQAARQGVSNLGADAANRSQTMNRFTMPGQQYSDKLGKARSMSEQFGGQSKFYGDKRDAALKQQGELWGGAGKLGMSALSQFGGGLGGAGSQAMGATTPGKQTGAQPGGYNTNPQSTGPQEDSYDYSPKEDQSTMYAAYGGYVDGQPEVEGDSYANDNVNAKLSPGEVVVPRSMVGESPDQIGSFVNDEQKKAKINALMKMRGM